MLSINKIKNKINDSIYQAKESDELFRSSDKDTQKRYIEAFSQKAHEYLKDVEEKNASSQNRYMTYAGAGLIGIPALTALGYMAGGGVSAVGLVAAFSGFTIGGTSMIVGLAKHAKRENLYFNSEKARKLGITDVSEFVARSIVSSKDTLMTSLSDKFRLPSSKTASIMKELSDSILSEKKNTSDYNRDEDVGASLRETLNFASGGMPESKEKHTNKQDLQ